jgi:hypothetical protein
MMEWVQRVLNSPEVGARAIELITIEQLFEKGIRGDGTSLGEYAPLTISIKQRKGLPTDRVTLFDEGDFYRSFSFEAEGQIYKVMAEDEKQDKALSEVYGESIIELTEENKGVLARFTVPFSVYEINSILFKRT